MSSYARANVVTMPAPTTTAQEQAASNIDIGALITAPLSAVVGTGMLLAEGLMWCGKKMKQNYEDACQSFTNLAISELEAQRAQKDDRRQVLTAMIDQFTTNRLEVFPSQQQTTATAQQQEQDAIADVLKRAQLTQNSEEQVKNFQADHERARWQSTLRNELSASRGIVSVAAIVAATAALQGSVQEMRAAHQSLLQARQKALQTITDVQILRTNQEQQSRHVQEQVQKELDVLQGMLMQSYGQVDQRFSDQIGGIHDLLQDVHRLVNSTADTYDPKRAFDTVQLARRDLQRLKEQVSIIVTDEMDLRQRQSLEAKGRLAALERMVAEAIQGQVVAARVGNDLLQRTNALHAEVERIDLSRANDQFKQLTERLDILAQQIFREIGEGQQKVVVDVIATTLSELGFYDDRDTHSPPTISMSGPSMKITAQRDTDTPDNEDGKRKERLVTFTVDRDGGVSYEFAGYVGQECLQAGNEVFVALKKKGITILDPVDAQRVNDKPAGSLTPQMLVNSPLAPHIIVNKQQALLGVKIREILYSKMGFEKVIESASEGSIVIEALKGEIGYHITLTREGETSVIRNGDDLYLNDTSDILVLQLNEAMQPALPEPEPPSLYSNETLPIKGKTSVEQTTYAPQQKQQLSE